MWILLINHIYTSTTRQQPVKDPKQSTARKFFHFPEHQTLPFPTLLILFLLTMISHLLFHSPNALLCLLRHTLFPWKCVAPKIHLPARDAVHHPRLTLETLSYTVDGLYELCVWFRPFVEVHVGGTDWHARISCIVDTVWYANWAHFFFLSGEVRV